MHNHKLLKGHNDVKGSLRKVGAGALFICKRCFQYKAHYVYVSVTELLFNFYFLL